MNIGAPPRGHRALMRALAVLPLLATACIAGQSVPSASPVLRVLAPAPGNAGATRDIFVTISNHRATPVVVLPNMIRLRIEGARAQYVPYPGPPIDPWEGAQELAPGAGTTVVFRDASDKRGVWRLPPGDYRIIALYEVTPDLVPPPAIVSPNRVWVGRVESEPASMTVGPARRSGG